MLRASPEIILIFLPLVVAMYRFDGQVWVLMSGRSVFTGVNWWHGWETGGGSAGVLGAGVLVFQHGLRRYESGNLMLMRE